MSTPPNILVFFTDQQRWDTVGLHGNPMGLTPNFDRLARAGTHFTQTSTCQPVCGPARSCMQTGRYATGTGVWRNGIGLDEEVPTLAHSLNAYGYATGYIGKWHLAGADNPRGPVPEGKRGGYTYWLAAEALEHTSDAYQTTLYDNNNQAVNLPGYRVDALTDAAIRYICTERTQPFFLFLSFLEPHHQNHIDDFPPPDGYRMPHTSQWIPPDLQALGGSTHQHLGGYYGMVKRLDEALGRIYDVLKSTGKLNNTVIVFASDHGCHFKTRNDEYKRSCHESSVRVPCFAWGGPFTGGGAVTQQVSLVDLPPTLLDCAGAAVPSGMQGASLLPLVRNRHTPWRKDAFIQISESCTARALRGSRWKYCVTAPAHTLPQQASADSYRESHLYDLECDPYELTNLIQFASHRELAGRLQARLLEQIEAIEGTRPQILPPEEIIPAGQRIVEPGLLDV